MFDGEFKSLEAICKTDTIRVPEPIKVLDHPSGRGAVFVQEYLDMNGLRKYQAQLGTQLGRHFTQSADCSIKLTLLITSDTEAGLLWSRLKSKIPEFFKGVDVKPSLLHGDLWSGNVAETHEGPVAFDPASFYGHHEYDLAIAGMFGGFTKAFYDAYHKEIPKQKGFEKRHELYKLFHHLNHWNHFGTGYRSSSLSIMQGLIDM
ncbi:PREDICTED: ketosamine-3-kinase-like isoform X3 [Acropora digitifera]|uniref:ketosamine-3-kinase-like isoform X3 n=1 Tax=Acropora digitifera TaxID=70779 RepID=UPI00077A24A7|nr:PREDICTED: ketosamine-3-kinase-like isoform X3 [Acropora digitifera]